MSRPNHLAHIAEAGLILRHAYEVEFLPFTTILCNYCTQINQYEVFCSIIGCLLLSYWKPLLKLNQFRIRLPVYIY